METERETETETDRQADRQAGRQRQTERETDRDRDTDRDRNRETERERQRYTENERQTDREPVFVRVSVCLCQRLTRSGQRREPRCPRTVAWSPTRSGQERWVLDVQPAASTSARNGAHCGTPPSVISNTIILIITLALAVVASSAPSSC